MLQHRMKDMFMLDPNHFGTEIPRIEKETNVFSAEVLISKDSILRKWLELCDEDALADVALNELAEYFRCHPK